VLIGASLGALTAAWHCARAAPDPIPIAAQVLIAPAFRILERYLAALGEFGRARWQRDGTYRFVGPWFEFDLKWSVIEDAERYSNAELLAAPRPPTLIVHGTADDSAPIAVSEEFVAACSAPSPSLVAIEGGDHRLTEHKERLLDEILRFIGIEVGPASRKESRRERCSGSSS
jgi:pimeloyl-ACP methyl ester carboxylesterase